MFSHTHKGQPYNTPLLARFVGPSQTLLNNQLAPPRLIDYELLTNNDAKRTVAFGWFAGGMSDAFVPLTVVFTLVLQSLEYSNLSLRWHTPISKSVSPPHSSYALAYFDFDFT